MPAYGGSSGRVTGPAGHGMLQFSAIAPVTKKQMLNVASGQDYAQRNMVSDDETLAIWTCVMPLSGGNASCHSYPLGDCLNCF